MLAHLKQPWCLSQSARGSELGFLVLVFTPNHFTPSQTPLPWAAEGEQEAITHTGQTAIALARPGLGKIYVCECKHLKIACGLGSPNYRDKPTSLTVNKDELDMEVHESEHLRHSGCASHSHPSAAVAQGPWSHSLQNVQHLTWDLSPWLVLFSVHGGYCVQAHFGDCMHWETAVTLVIYSNWTW